MAEHLYLVRRLSTATGGDPQPRKTGDRNGLRQCLFNNDDGDSDAVIMQNLIDALNAVTPTGDFHTPGDNAYPDGYFDEVLDVSDLSGTGEDNLRTPGDFIALGPEVVSVTTAAV